MKVAEIDDTICISRLIGEICREYEVSQRTAKVYIDEIVIMGLALRNGDFLWHKAEIDIQATYLDKKESEAIKNLEKSSSKQSTAVTS